MELFKIHTTCQRTHTTPCPYQITHNIHQTICIGTNKSETNNTKEICWCCCRCCFVVVDDGDEDDGDGSNGIGIHSLQVLLYTKKKLQKTSFSFIVVAVAATAAVVDVVVVVLRCRRHLHNSLAGWLPIHIYTNHMKSTDGIHEYIQLELNFGRFMHLRLACTMLIQLLTRSVTVNIDRVCEQKRGAAINIHTHHSLRLKHIFHLILLQIGIRIFDRCWNKTLIHDRYRLLLVVINVTRRIFEKYQSKDKYRQMTISVGGIDKKKSNIPEYHLWKC